MKDKATRLTDTENKRIRWIYRRGQKGGKGGRTDWRRKLREQGEGGREGTERQIRCSDARNQRRRCSKGRKERKGERTEAAVKQELNQTRPIPSHCGSALVLWDI